MSDSIYAFVRAASRLMLVPYCGTCANAVVTAHSAVAIAANVTERIDLIAKFMSFSLKSYFGFRKAQSIGADVFTSCG